MNNFMSRDRHNALCNTNSYLQPIWAKKPFVQKIVPLNPPPHNYFISFLILCWRWRPAHSGSPWHNQSPHRSATCNSTPRWVRLWLNFITGEETIAPLEHDVIFRVSFLQFPATCNPVRHTPRTCYNIAALAEAGYYNNTIFHRIIKGFMIQGATRKLHYCS